MTHEIIKIQFLEDVSPDEVEAALLLARYATESIYGVPRLRLDGPHEFDREQLLFTVDATESVGQTLCRLFLGFIARELDDECYSVWRVFQADVPAAQ